jgi:NADH dehydrogenase FAD-containing subunit
VLAVVQVDPQLRVVGHPRLFALGDVTDVPEEKLAFLAKKQGDLVAGNITTLAAAAAAVGAAAGAAAAAAAGTSPGREEALQAANGKLRAWWPSAGLQVMMVSIGRK